MVGTANIPRLADTLEQLYQTLLLDRTNEKDSANGAWANRAFTQFHSTEARGRLAKIDEQVEAYWKKDEKGSEGIDVFRSNGDLRCRTNQKSGDDSLQEVYRGTKLDGNYWLYALLVEKDKKLGDADIGLFLTDENDGLVYGRAFDYQTDCRLNYGSIVDAMVDRLRHKLSRIRLDSDVTMQERLQRITVLEKAFDIEDLITAIHTYGPTNVKHEKYLIKV